MHICLICFYAYAIMILDVNVFCLMMYMYVKPDVVFSRLLLCQDSCCVTFRGRNGIYFRVKIYSSLRGSSCGKPQVLTCFDSQFFM